MDLPKNGGDTPTPPDAMALIIITCSLDGHMKKMDKVLDMNKISLIQDGFVPPEAGEGDGNGDEAEAEEQEEYQDLV